MQTIFIVIAILLFTPESGGDILERLRNRSPTRHNRFVQKPVQISKRIVPMSEEYPLIPALLFKAILEIEKHWISQEGIYRVSGNTLKVDALYKSFVNGGHEDIAKLEGNVLASFVKKVFRDYAPCQLSEQNKKDLLNAVTGKTVTDQALIDVIIYFPPVAKITLLFLLQHLQKVVLHQWSNKMGVENIATVFAPTIFQFHEAGNTDISAMITVYISALERLLAIDPNQLDNIIRRGVEFKIYHAFSNLDAPALDNLDALAFSNLNEPRNRKAVYRG